MKPLCSLVVFLAVAFAGVQAGGEGCTTGGVCCRDCTTRCPQETLACFSNCKSPCFGAKDCVDLGGIVAQGVAVAACEQTKSDCKVAITSRTSAALAFPSLDLKTCCQVIFGSCAGNAEVVPCQSASYGSCTKSEFHRKHKEYVASLCKDAICKDQFCSSELSGTRLCR